MHTMIDQDNLSAEDVKRMMRAIVELWYKPFSKLRKLRSAAGYKAQPGLTKTQCILDILTNPENAQAVAMGPSMEEQLQELKNEITNAKYTEANLRTELEAERAHINATDRYSGTVRKERDAAIAQRDELLGTMRQLMRL